MFVSGRVVSDGSDVKILNWLRLLQKIGALSRWWLNLWTNPFPKKYGQVNWGIIFPGMKMTKKKETARGRLLTQRNGAELVFGLNLHGTPFIDGSFSRNLATWFGVYRGLPCLGNFPSWKLGLSSTKESIRIYHLERIDGATPISLGLFFGPEMSPSPPFGSGTSRHLRTHHRTIGVSLCRGGCVMLVSGRLLDSKNLQTLMAGQPTPTP